MSVRTRFYVSSAHFEPVHSIFRSHGMYECGRKIPNTLSDLPMYMSILVIVILLKMAKYYLSSKHNRPFSVFVFADNCIILARLLHMHITANIKAATNQYLWDNSYDIYITIHFQFGKKYIYKLFTTTMYNKLHCHNIHSRAN